MPGAGNPGEGAERVQTAIPSGSFQSADGSGRCKLTAKLRALEMSPDMSDQGHPKPPSGCGVSTAHREEQTGTRKPGCQGTHTPSPVQDGKYRNSEPRWGCLKPKREVIFPGALRSAHSPRRTSVHVPRRAALPPNTRKNPETHSPHRVHGGSGAFPKRISCPLPKDSQVFVRSSRRQK